MTICQMNESVQSQFLDGVLFFYSTICKRMATDGGGGEVDGTSEALVRIGLNLIFQTIQFTSKGLLGRVNCKCSRKLDLNIITTESYVRVIWPLPNLVLEWSRKVQSIGVDSEGAKHLFSLCEKRHFTPVQSRLRHL